MLKVYEFKEVQQPKQPQYVTREDFESFKKELLNIMKGGNTDESNISK